MIARDVIGLMLDWTAILALALGLACGALATIPVIALLGHRGR